jgi:hypothetical protein
MHRAGLTIMQTGVSNIIGGDVKSRLNKQAALYLLWKNQSIRPV